MSRLPKNLGRLDKKNGQPLYQQLERLLKGAIERNVIGPNDALPPERDLASTLKISRATVVSAYRELEARGLVRGYVGRGTFVSAKPDAASAPFAWRGKIAAAALQATDSTVRDLVRAAADPALMSLAAGVPALDCFPKDAFQRAMNHVLSRSDEAAWRHGPTEGMPRFRAALAERFGGSPEHILVLAGAQQGLDLLARCLIDPGDAVVVDRPGYLGAIQTFRNAGARLLGWDISRAEKVAFARKRGIPVPHTADSPYTTDVNLWGRSCETGVLEDPWVTPPDDAYAWTVKPSAPASPRFPRRRTRRSSPSKDWAPT